MKTIISVSEPKPTTCQNIQCGSNALCKQANNTFSCMCKPGFFGNPWLACRPECVLNTECPFNKACISNKCRDPCAGACGVNAQCDIINHVPVCYCPADFSGDPFVSCYPFRPTSPPAIGKPINPCDPSPCGPYSRCLVSQQGYATCSCLPGYKGVAPTCKPECIVSSECPQTQACMNQKCIDPCPGTCAVNAQCIVINHNPICSCPPGYEGDPFSNCVLPIVELEPKRPENPCVPSPCGPNSICQIKRGRPVCSCIANYIGNPPNCRPECVISQECPQDKACVKEKCINPCAGSCGQNAKCNVVNHTPFCSCLPGFEGDAFVECSRTPESKYFYTRNNISYFIFSLSYCQKLILFIISLQKYLVRVHHHHVQTMHSVRNRMVLLDAHAFHRTLATRILAAVNQSVLSTLTVQAIWLVYLSIAEIHARDCVEPIQNVL